MSDQQRQLLRTLLAAGLLACGTLLAPAVDSGAPRQAAVAYSATLFDAPRFLVRLGRNRLYVAGTTVSPEHESALLQLAREQFASAEITTDFQAAVNIAPDWETRSSGLLYLVAATESAEAVLEPGGTVIRGVSRDAAAFAQRRALLGDAVAAGHNVETDVMLLSNDDSFDNLCRRNFSSIAAEPVRFRQSSTSIRESSHPLLDRLAEFAYDCRAAKIALIGHTDATGSAAWNVQVSRARAETIATELVYRGVPREHLIVEGRGAAQPIADNATVSGRERNRRIELELR